MMLFVHFIHHSSTDRALRFTVHDQAALPENSTVDCPGCRNQNGPSRVCGVRSANNGRPGVAVTLFHVHMGSSST
jgi:hypothetical protein